jgi:hypothetical protein
MPDHKQPALVWVSLLLVSLGLALVSEAAERPKDFRGIRWGTSIHRVPGLQFDAYRQGSAPEVAYYIRTSDDRTILGGEVDAIRYLVADDTIIGVAIRFRQDMNGLGHCQRAMTELRELYGAPNQRREVFSAPETRALTHTMVAGPKMPFSTVHQWFATDETEATIEIACPAQAQSFPGYLQLIWPARVPQQPGVGIMAPFPAKAER